MNLVEIKKEIPDVILDIRYATRDNFTGQVIYENPIALLEETALKALSKAAKEFRDKGYRIVIFDSWRPPEAQEKLREYCDDPNYVAENPRHASGKIVDMSLAREDGEYLDMGTDYDDFTEAAHSDDRLVNEVVKANRELLRSTMQDNGFKPYSYEWWDFEYLGTE